MTYRNTDSYWKNVKTIEFNAGTSIEKAAYEAIELAKQENCIVKFDFNGVAMNVTPPASQDEVVANYIRRLENYCRPNKSRPTNAIPRLKAELESRKQKKWKKELADEMKNVKIEVSYPLLWANLVKISSTDRFSRAVIRYAELWAKLMQTKMQKEPISKSLIESASHEADVEGITGYMHACAQVDLVAAWIHGEEMGKAMGWKEAQILKNRRIAEAEEQKLRQAR